MFDSSKVVKEYGISGIIMPYLWLFIYIFFHYQFIGFWFAKPSFVDYISLIIHIALTAVAVLFSHKVLLWAASQSKQNKVANFFAAIIRKMTDSPIELINFIIVPFEQRVDESKSWIGHVIYNVLYVLTSIFFGYVIFIIVSLIYTLIYLLDQREDKVS